MRIDRAAAALGLGVAVALGGVAVAQALAAADDPIVVELTIRYSRFEPVLVRVPAGREVTFVIRNTDPIDHEWIVGDDAVHERHRNGTEPVHHARPTEVTVAALEERRTTVTFSAAGSLAFICHLPGHEAYGMVGSVAVTAP
jgi:uncharacterized cupredoxin-like copper-binding protein